MKVVGVILIVVGVLSFLAGLGMNIAAAFIGLIFWAGIGGYLVYLAEQRKKPVIPTSAFYDQVQPTETEQTLPPRPQVVSQVGADSSPHSQSFEQGLFDE